MRLKTETGKDVAGFIPLDLSDLPSVKAAADQYMRFVALSDTVSTDGSHNFVTTTASPRAHA